MQKELKFWRFLTHFWGLITAFFFIINFLNIMDFSNVLQTLTIVYISILSIFSSIKEFNRWQNNKFISLHKGEVFVIFYTILMITFIIFSALNPDQYQIQGEFTATYLSILGIFAITNKSKLLKLK